MVEFALTLVFYGSFKHVFCLCLQESTIVVLVNKSCEVQKKTKQTEEQGQRATTTRGTAIRAIDLILLLVGTSLDCGTLDRRGALVLLAVHGLEAEDDNHEEERNASKVHVALIAEQLDLIRQITKDGVLVIMLLQVIQEPHGICELNGDNARQHLGRCLHRLLLLKCIEARQHPSCEELGQWETENENDNDLNEQQEIRQPQSWIHCNRVITKL